MIFTETTLKGNFLIDLEPKIDDRGFFSRLFCENEFSKNGLNSTWVQINNSLSNCLGTLRGLHFQSRPNEETKLVRCVKGKIWDVVVDVRKESPTFGKWFGETLSATNRTMMYVPEGFAHGFISLEPESEILYLVSKFYEPTAEKTLRWDDPHVAIQWPIKPSVISEKDSRGEFFQTLIA